MLYAGLPDHPGHALHASQSSGAGSVVCFTTGDRALSQRVVSNTRLFNITVSFGSVHSLISCPCDMSHASIPAEVRASRDGAERPTLATRVAALSPSLGKPSSCLARSLSL